MNRDNARKSKYAAVVLCVYECIVINTVKGSWYVYATLFAFESDWKQHKPLKLYAVDNAYIVEH